VGLDRDGKIASWPGRAADSTGRKAQFFAYAGDHYSGMRPRSYHFCIGCHPGHTFLDDTVNHAEKVRP
jgi:hypothetical protein